MTGEKALRWAGILLFLAVVFSPLLGLLVELFRAVAAGHADWLSLVIPGGRRLVLLLRTIALAISVSAGGMIIGVMAGIILWRWNKGIARYLPWLTLILVPIPPYIHALSWSSFINFINSFLVQFHLPEIALYGELLTWWVQLMSLAPLAIGLTLVAMKTISPALVEAGRIIRPDMQCLFKVILPLISPLLLAGGGLLFIFSLMDYSIPYLFQVNVYSMEIFVEYSASSESVRAFLISIPLLIIAIAVILLSQSALKNVTRSTSWYSIIWKTPPYWPSWFHVFQIIMLVVLAAQIFVPFSTLLITSFQVPDITSTVGSASGEIVYSTWLALLSAILSIPLAAAVAPELIKSRASALWWIPVTCALAIPPALTGIGLITVWNNPILSSVYGTSFMPVLAALARFTPLAVIVVAAQLRRIDPLLIDAAKVLQTRPFQTWYKIWLPMTSPGLLAAAGMVFALTAGELAATLIVAAPGQGTLTMRIYNLLHYGATDSVALLCLIIFAATLLAGILAAWAFTRRNTAVSREI